jgi:hypothetical protein
MRQVIKIFIYITMISLFVSAGEEPMKKPPGPHPKFTDVQKACLKNTAVSGLPEGGAKPTHEEMLAATTKCKIEVDTTIEKLRDKYASTDDEDEQDKIKADMRTIFYATESEVVRQKVRQFFKDYRDEGGATSVRPAAARSSGPK